MERAGCRREMVRPSFHAICCKDGKSVSMWCPSCKEDHIHSRTHGARHAHCHNGPLIESGYILKKFHTNTQEAKRIIRVWNNRNYKEWLRLTGNGGLACPVCEAWYAEGMHEIGDKCSDLSHGQPWPCAGRLVDATELRIQMFTEHPHYNKTKKGQAMKDAVVRLHANASGSLAISTDAGSEDAFVREFASVIGDEFEDVQTGDNPEAQTGDGQRDKLIGVLRVALPLAIEIVCKLRGYKSQVSERRVLIAGEFVPEDVVRLFADKVNSNVTQ